MTDDDRAALAAALHERICERKYDPPNHEVGHVTYECDPDLILAAMPNWHLVPADAVPVDAERLRAALLDYGVHRKGCKAWKVDTHRVDADLPQCDCGLRAALAPPRVAYPRGYDHRPGCSRTHPVTGPCSVPAPSEPEVNLGK